MSALRWLLLTWLAGVRPISAGELALRFADESGRPLDRVSVRALLMTEDDPRAQSMDDAKGLTKADGFFRFEPRKQLTMLQAQGERAGFYTVDLRTPARFARPGPGGSSVWTLTMPRKIKPIPLCAFRPWLSRGNGQFRRDVWIAYDLRLGSPLPPFGRGEVEDFRFQVTAVMTGWNAPRAYVDEQRRIPPAKLWDEETVRDVYGVWQAELRLAFPHPQAGILRSEQFWPYARLKMPHAAPAAGYRPDFKAVHVSDRPADEAEDEVGYWLRTRVKTDDAGKIVEAHYAKIVGPLRFTQATLGFTYCFNPTPSDRNLEFDPKRNLLRAPPDASGEQLASYQVGDP